MQFASAYIALLFGLTASLSAAAPTVRRAANISAFPLSDGFPSPSSQQIKQIEQHALGTLPNGPPPPRISAEGITNLQVIALNELFEVAFFTDLLFNVTHNVTGYEIDNAREREILIQALVAVQAQEQLHAINANGALAHFGFAPIQPCRYSFPVTDLRSAVSLASTFTSVVLGTLQDVIQVFAQNGDDALTRAVASVVGQEGEQEGFYRTLLGKRPSELPFLTTATRDLAVNALNHTFFVPGSCPNLGAINFRRFSPLTLLTAVSEPATTQQVRFELDLVGSDYYSSALVPPSASARPIDELHLVYINQLNIPILQPFSVIEATASSATVEATFPYAQNEMNGLTIAVLARGNASTLVDATAVSAATEFGPALIIV